MADSTSARRSTEVFDDPRLRAFLPMLYVAWADGDLTAQEMDALSETLTEGGELESGLCGELSRWLDPEAPPSAEELHRLLGAIRRAGSGLSRAERRGLAELGSELVRAGGHEPAPAETRALRKVEGALGLGAVDVAGRLLRPAPPEPVAPPPAEPAPAFDVAAMTRLLDGERHDLRQRVRELLAGDDFAYLPDEVTSDRRAYRERVFAWCRRLAEEGLGSLAMPEEHGGQGDPGGFVAAFETLAHHDLSLLVKFGVQFGLFGGAVLQLGTERHHAAYLPGAATLELPGCFAMTETDHGSNVQGLETTASFDREAQEFVLTTPHSGARKDYIGNAALHGEMAVVFAQLLLPSQSAGEDGASAEEESRGVHAFVVPIRGEDGEPLPGVRIEDCGPKLGLEGVDNGRLDFDGVRVPREALLDRFASVTQEGGYESSIASPGRRFFTMVGTLVGGRIAVALGAVSATKNALTIAIRYGARRRQFGPEGRGEAVVLDYLTHQRRLFRPLAGVFAFHFALHRLADRYAAGPEGEERREVETLAAGLKALATWHATSTIQTCREACGGEGYLSVNRFAALKADTDVFTTFEGDNVVLLQLVAKGLLSSFRQEVGDMNWVGLVRMVAGRAAHAVAERNPILVRRTATEHLRDPEFHDAALRTREDSLVYSLARRMKALIDDGTDPFDALIRCQDHALAAARAFTERVAYDAFRRAVGAVEDPALARPLILLRDLYALDRLAEDRGWFLEHDLFEDAKAKAIQAQVNELCRELRPDAVALVDAFAIPKSLIAAPIAT
jgi:acyl-CoA oxidase